MLRGIGVSPPEFPATVAPLPTVRASPAAAGKTPAHADIVAMRTHAAAKQQVQLWPPGQNTQKLLMILHCELRDAVCVSMPTVATDTQATTDTRTCRRRCLMTSRSGICTRPLKWLIML